MSDHLVSILLFIQGHFLNFELIVVGRETRVSLSGKNNVIMADTSIEILEILRHYFKLGLKATEAARRIREVEGNETISDRTAQNWFKRFKDGDLSLIIKPRSGRPSVVDYDALKRKVEENPNTSTRKLSEELGSSKDTICRALHKLKKAYRSSQNGNAFDSPQYLGIDQVFMDKKDIDISEDKKIYTGDKTYSCEICGSRFCTRLDLQQHIKTHFTEQPFSCEVSRTNHIKTNTGEKPFSCEICLSRFYSNSYLKCHMRTHYREKPFSCEICGLRFTFSSYLKSHMKTHTENKLFCCEICDCRFYTSSHFQRHMKIHIENHPFPCESCGSKFSINENLQRHMKIHSGEKPFCCEICGSRFSSNSYLKCHLKIHTGEKPFSCGLCEAQFSLAVSFYYHIKGGREENRITCEFCGLMFPPKCLKKHIKRHVE